MRIAVSFSEEELLKSIKNTIRVSLSNPYDLAGEIIKDKKEIDDYYKNFPKQSFLIYQKGKLFFIPQMAKKFSKETNLDFEDSVERFWKKVKIYETLVRNGEVGKNSEFLKIAGIFTAELKARLKALRKKLIENPENREVYLEEIEKTKDIEKNIHKLLEYRASKLRNIEKITETKDMLLEELINKKEFKAIFKPLYNAFEGKKSQTALEIIDKLNLSVKEFAYDTLLELRKNLLSDKSEDYIINLRDKLLKDERFKNFLKSLNPKEQSLIKGSAQHLIFFSKLLELEDRIFQVLREGKDKVRETIKENVADLERKLDFKRLNNGEILKHLIEEIKQGNDIEKNTRSLIRQLQEIKHLPGISENEKELRELLEVLKGIKQFEDLRGENRSLLLHTEIRQPNLFNAIEKYSHFVSDTHDRMLTELTQLHNFDLLVWKLNNRELGFGQLERLLNSPALSLSKDLKETIKNLYRFQLGENERAETNYLSPQEYSDILRSILLKGETKKLYEYLNDERIYYGRKNLYEAYSTITNALLYPKFKITTYGDKLKECIEKGIISEGATEKVANKCFEEILEKERKEAKKMEQIAKSYFESDVRRVFFYPIAYTLILASDIKNTSLELMEFRQKIQKWEIDKEVRDIVLNTFDEEERDLKIRKLAYDNLGIWSEVSDKENALKTRDKVLATLLKDKVSELLEERERIEKVVRNVAKQKADNFDYEEAKFVIEKGIRFALKNGEKDLMLKGLKSLEEVLSKVELENRDFQKQFLETVREAKEDYRKFGFENRDLKTNKVERVLKTLMQDMDKNLTKKDKEKLEPSLKEVAGEILGEFMVKSKYVETTIKNLKIGLAEIKADNPLRLIDELKSLQMYGVKGKYNIGLEFIKEFKGEIERSLDLFKKSSMIIDGKHKSLVLFFKDLDQKELKLLRDNPNRFLVQKLNFDLTQFRKMLDDGILKHGLEYGVIFENLLKKTVDKKVLEKKKASKPAV